MSRQLSILIIILLSINLGIGHAVNVIIDDANYLNEVEYNSISPDPGDSSIQQSFEINYLLSFRQSPVSLTKSANIDFPALLGHLRAPPSK